MVKTRKGGMVDPGSLYVFGTMLIYGMISVVVGPLYLLAELFNAPISSLNKFSRKAFQNQESHIFHRPLYHILSMYTKPNLDKDQFLLEADTYIHKRVSTVSLDNDPDPKKDANGKVIPSAESEVKSITPSVKDTLLHTFGALRLGRQLKNLVFRLFDHIEQIPKTDTERKADINLLVYQLDFKSLVKCYLISKTIKSNTCEAIQNKKKTILRGADVITIINPFYHPCNPSYTKRLDCLKRHLTKKKFDKADKEDMECKVTCDNCTFLNSAIRLGDKYITSGAWIAVLAMLVSGVFSLPTVMAATGLSTVFGSSAAVASTAVKGAASKLITPGIKLIFDKLIKFLALYILYPSDFTSMAGSMLSVYFKHVKITNEEHVKSKIEAFDKELESIQSGVKVTQEKIEVFKFTSGFGSIANSVMGLTTSSQIKNERFVETNILKLLDEIKVNVDLTNAVLAETKVKDSYPDDEDKEEVLEKFNTFMCKYDIMATVKSRIAKKFVDKAKPARMILGFIFEESKQDV